LLPLSYPFLSPSPACSSTRFLAFPIKYVSYPRLDLPPGQLLTRTEVTPDARAPLYTFLSRISISAVLFPELISLLGVFTIPLVPQFVTPQLAAPLDVGAFVQFSGLGCSLHLVRCSGALTPLRLLSLSSPAHTRLCPFFALECPSGQRTPDPPSPPFPPTRSLRCSMAVFVCPRHALSVDSLTPPLLSLCLVFSF